MDLRLQKSVGPFTVVVIKLNRRIAVDVRYKRHCQQSIGGLPFQNTILVYFLVSAFQARFVNRTENGIKARAYE